MRARYLTALLLAICALVLVGCSSTDALQNTHWSLETLANQPVLADTKVTLDFEDGRLAGTDGCNQYSTSYTVQGSQINISQQIVSTRMACADPIMAQALVYTEALTKATAFNREGRSLTLRDVNGQVLATFGQREE